MLAVAVAVISAAAIIAAAYLNAKVADLGRQLVDARRDIEACARERKHLKHLLQLVVSAMIGQLPREERGRLLETIDRGLQALDDAA